jgi:hypothetical protein
VFGRRFTIAVLALCAVVWPGCQCGKLEIGPSNLVTAGRYQSLWGFPWGNDQKYILADRIDAQGNTLGKLTVIDVQTSKACDSDVKDPRWYWSLGTSLFVIEDIDWNSWSGRLVHLPLPCGPRDVLFEKVYLTVWLSPDSDFFYALVDVDAAAGTGRLVRIAWPSKDVAEVHTGVPTAGFSFDWPGHRYFYIDSAGKLVSTTLDGVEEGRLGDGVANYVSSGTGEILFEQSSKLYYSRVDGTELAELSENACSESFESAQISYVEPCATPHTIVLRDHQTRALLGRYGEGVAGRFSTSPEGWVSWLENQSADNQPGTLWVKPPDSPAVQVATQAAPNWSIIEASKVVLYAAPSGDKSASFMAYDIAKGTATTLAENVDPGLAIAESPWGDGHYAVVKDLATPSIPDGGAAPDRLGNLILIHPVSLENYALAQTVPVRGFRFSWQAPAIGYLMQYDPIDRSGDFEVFSMLDRKRFPVDHQVKEFGEVYAPKRGVTYIIRNADRPGIYFVEASVSLF